MKTFRNILFVFFGIHASMIHAQSHPIANPALETAVEIVATDTPTDNLSQQSQQGPIKDIYKTKDGQIFKSTYNANGQVIYGKRLGGLEFQLAYTNSTLKTPNAIKIGDRQWVFVSQLPANQLQLLQVGAEAILSEQLNAARYVAEHKSASDGTSLSGPVDLQKAPGDDEDKFKLTPYQLAQFLAWLEASFTGNGSGGGGGYCQSPYCSFPTLEACLGDCEAVKDIGLLFCAALSEFVLPALACGVAVLGGYYGICKPRCNAGLR
jgi:hypothetical protein